MFEEGSYRRRPRGFRRKCQSMAAQATGKMPFVMNTTASIAAGAAASNAVNAPAIAGSQSHQQQHQHHLANYATTTSGANDNGHSSSQSCSVSGELNGAVVAAGGNGGSGGGGSGGNGIGTNNLDLISADSAQQGALHRTNSASLSSTAADQFELTSLSSMTPSSGHFASYEHPFASQASCLMAPYSTYPLSSSTTLPSIDSTFAHTSSLSLSNAITSSAASSIPSISTLSSALPPTYASTLSEDTGTTNSLEYSANALSQCQYGTLDANSVLIDHSHHHHHHHQTQPFSQLWTSANTGGSSNTGSFMLHQSGSSNGSANSYAVTLPTSMHFIKNHYSPYGSSGEAALSPKMAQLMNSHANSSSQLANGSSLYSSATSYGHQQSGGGGGGGGNSSGSGSISSASHHHLQTHTPYAASAMLNDLSSAHQSAHLRNIGFSLPYGDASSSLGASPPNSSPSAPHSTPAAIISSLHHSGDFSGHPPSMSYLSQRSMMEGGNSNGGSTAVDQYSSTSEHLSGSGRLGTSTLGTSSVSCSVSSPSPATSNLLIKRECFWSSHCRFSGGAYVPQLSDVSVVDKTVEGAVHWLNRLMTHAQPFTLIQTFSHFLSFLSLSHTHTHTLMHNLSQSRRRVATNREVASPSRQYTPLVSVNSFTLRLFIWVKSHLANLTYYYSLHY